MRACASCVHVAKEISGQFSCRRNPPHPVPIMEARGGKTRMVGQMSIFPIVEPHWKCGEFQQGLDMSSFQNVLAEKPEKRGEH